MRTLPLRLLTIAVMPALILAGCADSKASSPSSSSATANAVQAEVDKITVTPGKDAASMPTLTLPTTPLRVKDPVSRVVKPGTGADIPERAWLEATFTSFSGVDAASIATTAGKPAVLRIGENDTTPPVFDTALKGQKVGAQVLVAIPASQILNEQQLPKGMSLDDTALYLVDVVGSRPVLDSAKGTPVAPKAGMPTAEVPDDVKQPAKISVPGAAPTKETSTQVLIAGAGKKVEKGQTVRVRYTGATWRDPSKPFDYSGKQDPPFTEFPIGTGNLIKAWDNNIPGQTVGSRLLMIVQPADGYGTTGRGEQIKGDDVMIFVLDILDAY